VNRIFSNAPILKFLLTRELKFLGEKIWKKFSCDEGAELVDASRRWKTFENVTQIAKRTNQQATKKNNRRKQTTVGYHRWCLFSRREFMIELGRISG
jgi:hypothetical protein